MIIALLFVIVFVIGAVFIPMAWFNQSHDWKTAFILWFGVLAVLYTFDAKVITELAFADFRFYSSLPWSGYP